MTTPIKQNSTYSVKNGTPYGGGSSKKARSAASMTPLRTNRSFQTKPHENGEQQPDVVGGEGIQGTWGVIAIIDSVVRICIFIFPSYTFLVSTKLRFVCVR
jgi:hypothetical protein